MPEPLTYTMNPNAVVQLVESLTGVPEQEMIGENRSARVRQARLLCCLVLRDHAGWSYPELGAFLLKDHSTIQHLMRTLRTPAAEALAERIAAKVRVDTSALLDVE